MSDRSPAATTGSAPGRVAASSSNAIALGKPASPTAMSWTSTPRATSASGPAVDGSPTATRAPQSWSTYRSSAGASRKFTGVGTPPRSCSAQYASTCSRRLRSAKSTRSPRPTPTRRKPSASARARAASSAYVNRRSPSTTASACGRRRAARSRTAASVKGRGGPCPCFGDRARAAPRRARPSARTRGRSRAPAGPPRREVVERRGRLGDGAEIGADDPEFFRVHVAQVEPAPVRVVRADGDERPQSGQRIGGALERLAADVLDDDVDATLAGPPFGFLDEILRAVVDDVVGAEAARELDLVVAADGRHHARADQPRDLNGRAADAAAGRLHEHRLAGSHVGLRDQRVPGGEHGQR